MCFCVMLDNIHAVTTNASLLKTVWSFLATNLLEISHGSSKDLYIPNTKTTVPLPSCPLFSIHLSFSSVKSLGPSE